MPPSEGGEAAPAQRLSTAREAEIRLEEIYRDEVRQKLSPQRQGAWPAFLRFLNTSLGIWLLSTVLVSGLGTAYALAKESWDRERTVEAENRKRDQDRTDAMSRLDLEIGFRISNLLNYVGEKHEQQLEAVREKKEPQPVTTKRISLILQVPPDQSVQYNYPSLSLYQEYRGTTLLSLLAELSRLERQRATALSSGEVTPAQGQKKEDAVADATAASAAIDQVAARVSDISPLFRDIATTPLNGELLARKINETLLLPRWKNNYFSYTDCPSTKPFC